jgi:acyl carrier protein
MIKDTIRHYISTEIAVGGANRTISDTDQLIEKGIIDSLGIMTLLNFLETEFDVQIDGDDLSPENFSSVTAISDLVVRKTGLSAGP